ncbi:PilZ domain-containing protein [Sphingobium cloacae]|nr:PilZ domain-containing protein [Sphingobium cloacae]
MKYRTIDAERPAGPDRKERGAVRQSVSIAVKVRRPGENWFTSRITNLSLTGFRLQSFAKLSPGKELWVALPGFEGRRAVVLWTQAHEAGCVFDKPLHPAILDHVIKQARHSPVN